MKTSIKLVLLYFACQIIGAVTAMAGCFIYCFLKHGNLDADYVQRVSLAPAMLLGFIFMGAYLWLAGYISRDKATWSPVSATYLAFTAGIYFAALFLIDFIMSLIPPLPNILEDTFNLLQSGWLGIFCIAISGPILEELLFRGAITKALLRHYSPAKAIVLSSVIFGVFHINPAQILPAFLIGLLLTWIYYKTASLIPCILVHILNNSLSVYLNLNYPDIENTRDVFANPNTYYLCVACAVVVLIGLFMIMRRITVPYPRRTENGKNGV